MYHRFDPRFSAMLASRAPAGTLADEAAERFIRFGKGSPSYLATTVDLGATDGSLYRGVNLHDAAAARAAKQARGCDVWNTRLGQTNASIALAPAAVVECDSSSIEAQMERLEYLQNAGLPAPTMIVSSGEGPDDGLFAHILSSRQALKKTGPGRASNLVAEVGRGLQVEENTQARDLFRLLSEPGCQVSDIAELDLSDLFRIGKSLHFWWVFDQAIPVSDPTVQQLAGGLAVLFQGDHQTLDLARVMREGGVLGQHGWRFSWQPVVQYTGQSVDPAAFLSNIDSLLDGEGFDRGRGLEALKTAKQLENSIKHLVDAPASLAAQIRRVAKQIRENRDSARTELTALRAAIAAHTPKKVAAHDSAQPTTPTPAVQSLTILHSPTSMTSMAVIEGLGRVHDHRCTPCPVCGHTSACRILSGGFHCFACQKHFNLVEFVMAASQVDREKARKWLGISTPDLEIDWSREGVEELDPQKSEGDVKPALQSEDSENDWFSALFSVPTVQNRESLREMRKDHDSAQTGGIEHKHTSAELTDRNGATVEQALEGRRVTHAAAEYPEDLCTQLQQPGFQVFALKAGKGTGKTIALNHLARQSNSSLHISFRISLATAWAHTLAKPSYDGTPGVECTLHTEAEGKIQATHAACCINSIRRVELPESGRFDVVILDEIMPLIRHIFGSTIRPVERHKVVEYLSALLTSARQVWCSDADMDFRFLAQCMAVLGIPEQKILEIHNTFIPPKTVRLYPTSKGGRLALEEHLFAQLAAGKNCFVAMTHSPREAKKLAEHAKLRVPSLRSVLVVSSDDEALTREISASPDEYIAEHSPQLLVATPSLQTGVSFAAKDYWDSVYGIAHTGNQLAGDIDQMTSRIRHPANTEVHQYIDGKKGSLEVNPNKILSALKTEDALDSNIREMISTLPATYAVVGGKMLGLVEDTRALRLFCLGTAYARSHGLNGLRSAFLEHCADNGTKVTIVDSVSKSDHAAALSAEESEIREGLKESEAQAQLAAEPLTEAEVADLESAPTRTRSHADRVRIEAHKRREHLGREATYDEIFSDLRAEKRRVGRELGRDLLVGSGFAKALANAAATRLVGGLIAQHKEGGVRAIFRHSLLRRAGLEHDLSGSVDEASLTRFDVIVRELKNRTLCAEMLGIQVDSVDTYKTKLSRWQAAFDARQAALDAIDARQELNSRQKRAQQKLIRNDKRFALPQKPKSARWILADLLRQMGLRLSENETGSCAVDPESIASVLPWATHYADGLRELFGNPTPASDGMTDDFELLLA